MPQSSSKKQPAGWYTGRPRLRLSLYYARNAQHRTQLPMPDSAPRDLALDSRALAKAYAAGHSDKVLEMLHDWLAIYGGPSLLHPLSQHQQRAVNQGVESLVYYLTRPDLRFGKRAVRRLLKQHPVLTNVIALSDYRSSDHWLRNLLQRGGSMRIPAMLLHNARNGLAGDRATYFDLDADLASEWYGQYFFGVPGFASSIAQENLREHLTFWDERMQLPMSVSNGYMRSTYIDPTLDRVFKGNFNRLAQRVLGKVKIRNRPRGNRIGVITARWAPTHPTYKNRFPLFAALTDAFDLSLIHVGPKRDDLETSIFSSVHRVWLENGRFQSDFLFDNDLDILFFPDVGMSSESRYLSNMRFAPVQITTNSHPVSTFGSQIDYFLTGIESEEALERAPTHYSERLVLIPGIGTLPIKPSYLPQRKQARQNPLLIGCAWGALKFNHAHLQLLKTIADSSPVPVRYRFLPTLNRNSNYYLPFRHDLETILGGERVELFPSQSYERYMDCLAECALALDSFPFGGNTSIIDCLSLRIPIVTRKGWQFYNLAGPVLLERFGLGELNAESDAAFVRIALRLIADSEWRQRLMAPISRALVSQQMEATTDVDAFRKAMHYLIGHKAKSGKRAPLVFD
ncbi:hypothetical protein [Allochromatium palmeri]|nr:hypothetical protein [Allochromatium palmeri]